MQRERYHDRPTAKRLRRSIRQRRFSFAPIERTAGLTLAGVPADVEVVYLIGPRPVSWIAWALDDVREFGYVPGRHYTRDTTTPVFRYTRGDGSKIEVHTAASWFTDETGYTIEQATAAFDLLSVHVGRMYGGAPLLATPATTGRDLFIRDIPATRAYPVLPESLQELIRSTSSQGRIELLPPAGEQLRGLFEYDGRLMYAALCWGLPLGEPTHDHLNVFEPHASARYRVRVTVPHDWSHRFGMLGMYDSEARRLVYPAHAGHTFDTWCDGAELFAAWRNGWTFDVLERVVWPTLREQQSRGPLDTWATKLVQLRQRVRAAGADDPVVAELAANAVRSLILHAIGAFNGAPHYETRAVSIDDVRAVPDDVRPTIEGSHLVWFEETRPAWAQLSHPEWCGAIWGRARARLVEAPGRPRQGALYARGEVVAFRTDAIYVTTAQPWHDDGTVGRFRLKRRGFGPWRWPTTNRELLDLRPQLATVNEVVR